MEWIIWGPLVLFFHIITMVGVYNLSEKYGRNAVSWTWCSFFTFPIVCIIILLCIGETSKQREETIINEELLRNKIRKMITNEELKEEVIESIICHNCQSTNDKETKFCCSCGIDLNDSIICHNCQNINNRKNKFCYSCGTELSVLKGDLDDPEVLNNLLKILN